MTTITSPQSQHQHHDPHRNTTTIPFYPFPSLHHLHLYSTSLSPQPSRIIATSHPSLLPKGFTLNNRPQTSHLKFEVSNLTIDKRFEGFHRFLFLIQENNQLNEVLSSMVDTSPITEKVAIVNHGELDDGGHFGSNGDLGKSSEHASSDVLKLDDGEVVASSATVFETGESSKAAGEVVEEETVELEFEKVKPKLATHSIHCRNCRYEITKVILCLKVIKNHRPEPFEQPDDPKEENPPEAESGNANDETGTSEGPQAPKYTGIDDRREDMKRLPGASPESSFDIPSSSNGRGDWTIVGLPETESVVTVDALPRGRCWPGYEVVLAEILKSIVYGGLMEVIASLSVVASAAASDAATLTIVALALANVTGGIFMIGINLWDLRNDCDKENSSEEKKKEAKNKYKELIGQVNHFPIHAVFAILSFLIFGMIPPVVYGLSFLETNDKYITLVVVAASSLLYVALLAAFKAYINKCSVFEHFKTVGYYVISAVCVSGVSYVAGNLARRLMEELGFFDTSSGVGNPSLASF